MNHSLKISVAKEATGPGIVRCRTVSLRERLLRALLGDANRVMVLIPGPSVKALSIQELPEDNDDAESD